MSHRQDPQREMGRLSMKDYEGNEVVVGARIELHSACDLWVRGARFGTITEIANDNGTTADMVDMVREEDEDE